MPATLYLRSKAKVSPTDLWLHPAGADGGALPPISDSGALTSAAVLAALEALAEDGIVATAAILEGVEVGTVPPSGDFTLEDLGHFPVGTAIAAYEATPAIEVWLRGRTPQVLRPNPPAIPVEIQTMTPTGATFLLLEGGLTYYFIAVVPQKIPRHPSLPERSEDAWVSLARFID